jgi:hypothetical protein
MVAQSTYLETFVQKLREVVRLPSALVIYSMTTQETADKNQFVNDILTNFEEQLKRDYKAFERERQ